MAIRQKLLGTGKLKVIHYIASYQGACLFLANLNNIKCDTVVLKNLPLFRKFIKKNNIRVLKNFPKIKDTFVTCWGSYSRDLFLIKYLNQKKIFVTIRSASFLTNKLFEQKKLSFLEILPEFKTVMYFLINKICFVFKKYEKRVFYCVPNCFIKKFIPFKKSKLNKTFLKFLQNKYHKKIFQFKKIQGNKLLLIDLNNRTLQVDSNKIKKTHKIVIKNHPSSPKQKSYANAFVIPKEIPFEYCKKLFNLKDIKKFYFDEKSSLFSK